MSAHGAGYEALARLVGEDHPHGQAGLVIAPADWPTDAALDAEQPVVLWGREPLPPGTSPVRAARRALQRERGLRKLAHRPPDDRVVGGVHRLPPPKLGAGARSAVRSALLSGALVELARPASSGRLVDALVRAVGAVGPARSLHVASGGTVLLQAPLHGLPAVLRAAVNGSPADPRWAGEVLRRLAADPLVPPLLGAGDRHGTAWTAERVLPGRRPRGLTAALVRDVSAFCARLPRTEEPASLDDELSALAPHDPDSVLADVAGGLRSLLADLPAVTRHGDLWSGNLLVREGRLSAVLDWDGWSERGLPGVDLLHLLGTQQRLTGNLSLGQVVVQRPWEDDGVRTATAGYWSALGLSPTPSLREAVGVAWWAGQAAGDLRRTPRLGQDPRWVRDNVSVVLDQLARGRFLG